MKVLIVFLLGSVLFAQPQRQQQQQYPLMPPVNPRIDMEGFLKMAQKAAKHREKRRVTEAEFIQMGKAKGTIILDARSKMRFDMLHVKGAMNLSFSDIDVESLKTNLPNKNERILIYCNNNFKNSPEAFPDKIAISSLNISTYITLYNYGYRNIYELADELDPKTAALEFEPPIKK